MESSQNALTSRWLAKTSKPADLAELLGEQPGKVGSKVRYRGAGIQYFVSRQGSAQVDRGRPSTWLVREIPCPLSGCPDPPKRLTK